MNALILTKREIDFYLLSEIIKKQGIASQKILTARESINSILSIEYQFIIVDSDTADNEESIEEIKFVRALNSQIPIIMLSTNLRHNVIVKSYKAGCNEYLLKPFRFQDLFKAINKNVFFEYDYH